MSRTKIRPPVNRYRFAGEEDFEPFKSYLIDKRACCEEHADLIANTICHGIKEDTDLAALFYGDNAWCDFIGSINLGMPGFNLPNRFAEP